MAYGGDFLQQLIKQRRQGGGTGFGAEMQDSLQRRRARRAKRNAKLEGFRGLRDYVRQDEYTPRNAEQFGGYEQTEPEGESAGLGSLGSADAGGVPDFQGQMREHMNSGGQDLPTQDETHTPLQVGRVLT